MVVDQTNFPAVEMHGNAWHLQEGKNGSGMHKACKGRESCSRHICVWAKGTGNAGMVGRQRGISIRYEGMAGMVGRKKDKICSGRHKEAENKASKEGNTRRREGMGRQNARHYICPWGPWHGQELRQGQEGDMSTGERRKVHAVEV